MLSQNVSVECEKKCNKPLAVFIAKDLFEPYRDNESSHSKRPASNRL